MSRTGCNPIAFALATLALHIVVSGSSLARADVVRDGYRSIQVNVDVHGRNMLGDAANEPSIAVDPSAPQRMAIGFRQFDSVQSSLRQAGWAYSRDGGHHWIFGGSLAPGTFGSDPVLDAAMEGTLYYLSVSLNQLRLFRSPDGGATWGDPIWVLLGFIDKPWLTVDRTNGPGHGNLYIMGGPGWFWRSTDNGLTFGDGVEALSGIGTITVDPDGTLFTPQSRSSNAKFVDQEPFMEGLATPAYYFRRTDFVNGGGLMSQACVQSDHSHGPSRGSLYLLDLMTDDFDESTIVGVSRSEDGGDTWSDWVSVTDGKPEPYIVDKWFPMISVAPNGRVDVVWNDMRHDPARRTSVLYYSYSTDGARTWSRNQPLSPPFDHRVGYPSQSPKLGDYYTMVSDNLGVNIAYAATFNGEQDVYFLRVGPWDCNGNDTPDEQDIASGWSIDINANDIPDDCEVPQDADGNGRVNLLDFAAWQNCRGWADSRFAGRRVGGGQSGVVALSPAKGDAVDADPLCPRFDADANGHADLDDFAVFHEEFTRPQGPE